MAKRKRAKSASLALVPTPAPAPVVAQKTDRAPTLGQLMLPTDSEKWSAATTFGGITIEEMASILRNAATGPQYKLQDFFDWMLDTDPHLAAVYETRLVGLATLPWMIEPAKVDASRKAEAQAAADFVQRAFDGIEGFQTALHDLSDGIGRNVSVGEINWERRDCAWMPRCIEWRHSRRFSFAKDWSTRIYEQGEFGAEGKELEARKFVVHIPKQRAGYPVRTGLLRAAAWPWLFKRWLMKFALTGAERFGMPTPFAHIAESAPESVVRDLEEALRNLTQGMAAIGRGETRIDWMTGVLGDAKIYTDLLAYFDAAMSKCVLGSTLNTEGGANGNRAAAESQASSTIDPRKAYDAAALEDTLMRDLVRPILEFNTELFGNKLPPIPRFKFVLESAKENPIYAYHFQGKIVKRNEVRVSLGLEPLTIEQGGDELLDVGSQPGAAPMSAAGGQSADIPLARGLTSQTQSIQTSATYAHSVLTPLEIALSQPLGARRS